MLCPCCANNAAEIRDVEYSNSTALNMHMEDRHGVFELAKCLSKIVEDSDNTINDFEKERSLWKKEMQEEADCGYYTTAALAQLEVESIEKTINALKIIRNKYIEY